MKRMAVGFILGTVALCVGYAPNAAAVASTPTYPVDFCATLTSIPTIVNASSLLVGLLADAGPDENPDLYLELINALGCATADLNGTPVNDLPGPNGMLDGFELGLVGKDLNANANGARAAYEANFALVAGAVNSPSCSYCALLPAVVPGLDIALVTLLAGYATQGDPTTLGVIEILGGLLDSIGATMPASSAFTTLPNSYGPTGDRDSDGCTNQQEYNSDHSSITTYANNASNNAVHPAGCDVVPTSVLVSGPTNVEEGDALSLTAYGASGAFVWTKDFSPISGATGSSFSIDSVTSADTGAYQVQVTTAKAVLISPVHYVNVLPQGSLPVAGGLGLAALAGACAMAGASVIRRRK